MRRGAQVPAARARAGVAFREVEVGDVLVGFGKLQILAAGDMQDLPAEAAVAQSAFSMVITGEEPLLALPVQNVGQECNAA